MGGVLGCAMEAKRCQFAYWLFGDFVANRVICVVAFELRSADNISGQNQRKLDGMTSAPWRRVNRPDASST